MRIKVAFATKATSHLSAHAVKHSSLLVVTLGRTASRILTSTRVDARDIDALKSAVGDAALREMNRCDCSAFEVYVSNYQGGHMVLGHG